MKIEYASKFEVVIKMDSNKFYITTCEFYDWDNDSIGISHDEVIDWNDVMKPGELKKEIMSRIMLSLESLMSRSENQHTQLCNETQEGI